MRISDWSSDVCSSDLRATPMMVTATAFRIVSAMIFPFVSAPVGAHGDEVDAGEAAPVVGVGGADFEDRAREAFGVDSHSRAQALGDVRADAPGPPVIERSEGRR